MKRFPILLALMVAVLWVSPALAQAPAPAPAADDPEAIRTVEGAGAIAGGDRAAAKKTALALARRAAVREYMELLVPPGVLKAKTTEVEKILADSVKLVTDIQEQGTREESGKLVVKFKIRVLGAELKTRMSAAGLLPSGSLPPVFLMVRGIGMGDGFRSGWDPNPPESGENECEAAIAAELTRYGFTITSPQSGQADTARILSPGNDAERAEVFRYVHEKFKSEMMIVGMVSLEGEGKLVKVKLAAADLKREKLLWSGNRERTAPDAEMRSRVESATGLCRATAQEAVQSLYLARLPSLSAGSEREVILTVSGINNWTVMKEMEKRLRTEVPGVLSLNLSRMSPGVIEFKLRTALSSKSLADWIAANQFGGMGMKVEDLGDYEIKLKAIPPDPNAPPPAAPGTKPGKPGQPAPGVKPGATGTRPAPAPTIVPKPSAPTTTPKPAAPAAPKPAAPKPATPKPATPPSTAPRPK